MEAISEEDKSLLVVAVMCEDDTGAIDWNDVQRYLPDSSSCHQLEERFKAIKSSYAVVRSNFPREYFEGSCINYRAAVYHALQEVLGGIRRTDVKQPSGKAHLNSGEITPVGISKLVDAVDIATTDSFIDVGSGTGNVVVQIALETNISCYGIEVRAQLATKSAEEITKYAEKYPSIGRVRIISSNVRTLTMEDFKVVENCTILYSSNGLFEPPDNLALEDFVFSLPKLTTVILTSPFCSRCGPTCKQNFCVAWKKTQELWVQPTWTGEKIKLYIFSKFQSSSLFDEVLQM
jgi:hypothetical protein